MTREHINRILIEHGVTDISGAMLDALVGEETWGAAVPAILVALRRPTVSALRVGDKVRHLNRPDWNVGQVQSVSVETGIITCFFKADHGCFQVGCRPGNLAPVVSATPEAADVERVARAMYAAHCTYHGHGDGSRWTEEPALSRMSWRNQARAALSAMPDREQEVALLREHIAEQAKWAETRIEDGKELGASVWRIALEDIARENRAALQQGDKQ